jgi:hypothetical protein
VLTRVPSLCLVSIVASDLPKFLEDLCLVLSNPDNTTTRFELLEPLSAISGDLVSLRLGDKTVAAVCAVHDSPLNKGTRSRLLNDTSISTFAGPPRGNDVGYYSSSESDLTTFFTPSPTALAASRVP